MITNQRITSFPDLAAHVLYETAEDVLKEQRNIRKTYYQRQSGELDKNLQSRPFAVTKSPASMRLVIDYSRTIRFLDLKKTARGLNKRIYAPIYNKILYGYLYNYTIPRLRFTMRDNIKAQTTGKLQLILKDPIKV